MPLLYDIRLFRPTFRAVAQWFRFRPVIALPSLSTFELCVLLTACVGRHHVLDMRLLAQRLIGTAYVLMQITEVIIVWHLSAFFLFLIS